MKRAVAMTAVVAMLGGAAAAVSAAPIFADDFNRAVSASVGNGWSETESDDVDVSIVARSGADRQLQVRDDDPRGVASQRSGISTLGVASVFLAYEWAPTNNTEAGDVLWVEWRDGGAGDAPWTAIASRYPFAVSQRRATPSLVSRGTRTAAPPSITPRRNSWSGRRGCSCLDTGTVDKPCTPPDGRVPVTPGAREASYWQDCPRHGTGQTQGRRAP